MPRPRFTRAAPELRETILDVAAEEFAAQGYEGASLNRILLAAGLSKGAFYYYFDDKADLAATVIEHELAQFDADLRGLNETEISSAREFWAEVERFTQDSLERLQKSRHGPDVITRLGAAMARTPELLARCEPLFARGKEQVMAFWKRGQDVGAVRTDLAAPVLIAVVQGCKTALTAALMPTDRAATADEIAAFGKIHLDLVRRMVKPGGSR